MPKPETVNPAMVTDEQIAAEFRSYRARGTSRDHVAAMVRATVARSYPMDQYAAEVVRWTTILDRVWEESV